MKFIEGIAMLAADLKATIADFIFDLTSTQACRKEEELDPRTALVFALVGILIGIACGLAF